MAFEAKPKRRFSIAKREPRNLQPPRVAPNLEGKVKNRGIKPKKKPKQGS